jgi:hypothetical protein
MDEFICGPTKPMAPLPKGNKGGPGVYNGVKSGNLPGRTPSPNAVPEKVTEGARPQIKNER